MIEKKINQLDCDSDDKIMSRRDFFKQTMTKTVIISLGIVAVSLCLTTKDANAKCSCCTGCLKACTGCVNVR